MRPLIKKFIVIILILFFTNPFVYAKDYIKAKAVAVDSFNSQNNETEKIKFKIDNEIRIENSVLIPNNSIVELEIMQFQKEKRWHKSGFIVARVLNYINASQTVDLTYEDIYLVLRKYIKPDKLEIAITTLEIAGCTVASCFVPGVDIAYFFIKGAILRKKHPNRFKAGVINAYDNSIFWFPQKGRKIDLTKGDDVQFGTISKYRAYHTKAKIDLQKEKLLANQKEKEIKKILKRAKKQKPNAL